MGISLKVNIIVGLEFELTYYDISVQHVNRYAIVTHPLKKLGMLHFEENQLFIENYWYILISGQYFL